MKKNQTKSAKRSGKPADAVHQAAAPAPAGENKSKGAKAAAEPKKVRKQMSCLDAAAAVLKARGEPMRCKEMIDAIFAQKLWHTNAPTPAATLYSAILREVQKKGSEARFKKTERGHFALRA